MKLSFIVAIGYQRQMGLNQALPWHIKADFQNFKKVTMHHHLLMGRKTFESIGKPLPGRISIVVTRQSDYEVPPGHFVVSSPQEGIELATMMGETELFVLGGGELFNQLLNRVDRHYLSLVDYDGPADTFFPEYSLDDFKLHESKDHAANETEPAWRYQVWDRKNSR